ncbi:MAG TPA: CCA tRNA nucleotidyltransferase [Candidatus Acidoferrales bacterium]|nr:CCA tRNA nucleotidyltransferase [Candidatus Acidoferrales bacterium]
MALARLADNLGMDARQLAERICNVLRGAGYQAYLVGGCVRDILLGRPAQDFDVATDATPERMQALFPGSLGVGAAFGVILVLDRDSDARVEVATFRTDVGYSDGRRPDAVVFGKSAEEDVRRRDFTINGLLLDPRDARILDFVGGQADLRAGMVRAIGNPSERFREDKLRLLRAVRFAARFGYRIEEETYRAVCAQAGEIGSVSSERMRDELTRILTEGGARSGFALLDETGLLACVLPEVARMRGVQQPPEFHPEGDVWTHTLMLLEQLPAGASATLAWGALLHDVGKPPTFAPPRGPADRIRFDGHVEVGTRMAEEIAQRLRFSGEDTGRVAALVAQHLRFKDVFEMRTATLKRFVRQPHFQEHLELHRMDCLAAHGKLDAYEFVRKFVEETPAEAVRPARLVTGDDLKQMGLAPGPGYRQILEGVEEAQLEGRVTSREEALQFVREHSEAL